MSVIKAFVSVFSQGQEKPIERYKSRILLSDEHKESLNAFEKHLSDFLGLKDKMRTLGLGQYTLKIVISARNMQRTQTIVCFSMTNLIM